MWYPADVVSVGGSVDRLKVFDSDIFRAYLAKQEPAVFIGAINECPARSLWTNNYLKSALGNRTCDIYISKNGQFPGGEGKRDPDQHKTVELTFGDFLDRISNDGDAKTPLFWQGEHYYMYRGRNQHFDAVLGDVVAPAFLGAADSKLDGFWVSAAGNITPPHIDFMETGLAQIRGRKKVLLWPVSQISKLYLAPLGTDGARQSQIDIARPDLSRFPMFRSSSALECTLDPGDLLFIPFGYGHCVYSDTQSISVTWTWGDRLMHQIRRVLPTRLLAYCLSHPLNLLKAVVAFHRPSPAVSGRK